MTTRFLVIAAAALMLGACASSNNYVSLDEMTESQRNQVLEQCAGTQEGKERQDCIARHAPTASEEGQTCERVKVTGSRFGARVCTPVSQAQE